MKRAFSLIEVMVVVALLAVIILGLLAMFNQTQRAFTSSMSQTDMLVTGRAAGEILAREIEQEALPSPIGGLTFYTTNLATSVWPLNTPGDNRTNVLERLFFLTKYNTTWKGIAYFPQIDSSGAVATLLRMEGGPNVATLTNMSKIADGVVGFQVLAYDQGGALILTNNSTGSIRTFLGGAVPSYAFVSNAAPAYCEVEVSVLEDKTYRRYLSMTNTPALALQFLTNHAGNVQVFRQRITVRAVDPAAYQ